MSEEQPSLSRAERRKRRNDAETPFIFEPKLMKETPSKGFLETFCYTNIKPLMAGSAPTGEALITTAFTPEVFEDLATLVEENPPHLWQSVVGTVLLMEQSKLDVGERLRIAQAISEIVLPRRISPEIERKERLWRALRVGFRLFCTMAVIGYLCRLFIPYPLGKTLWQYITSLALVAFPYRVYRHMGYEKRRVQALEVAGLYTLTRLAVPESAPTLAQLTLKRSLDERYIYGLMTTLSNLTPKYYGRLDPELTPNLCELLSRSGSSYPEFTLVLLEALEKVGDSRAIRPLQHLMAPQTLADFPNRRRLKQLAERAMKVLQQRAEREPALNEEPPVEDESL